VLVKVADGTLKKEWIMDAVVRPGQLVETASSTRIQVLSATFDAVTRIVVEDFETAISATYASGDQVPFVIPQKGDEVMMYATAAALSTLAVGQALVSNGAGFGIYAASPIAGEQIATVMEVATIAADPGLVRVLVEVN
jgi:hypothetical protein